MNIALTPFAESMQAAAARLPDGEPAWLRDARRNALAVFEERGLPDTHNELWKYTALRALQRHVYAVGDAGAAMRKVPAELLSLDGTEGQRAVFVNGAFRADLSHLDDLPDGMTLQPLSLALRAESQPLRFVLGGHPDDADDGFTLLNRALAADGVMVRVADGVRVERPLHVLHVSLAAEASAAWHLRSRVELGRGAGLHLVEHHLGDAGNGHLANLVRNVNLHEGAQLGWTIVQRTSPDATLLRRSDCVLHEDASLDLHALELGGKLTRHELRVELAGARARLGSRGAFVLHGRQHADTEVLVSHRGRDTVSASVWRGVADGRARGVVHGRILVLPGADGADGGFYNKNLLLSPDAEIDTRPALEIHADEVKANHGATVGQLDENVLFYLRSRGIPLDAARRMLVHAFCAETLEGIEPVSLRAHCEALLADQLPEPSI
ncbi:MAG TPA: Fe-S cluster assembly protein SufD [Rhodanobacteraceae bacterium]|nr:Fe-S cluster assembly protein SufD [Rhodanobacteraceae bacterium]